MGAVPCRNMDGRDDPGLQLTLGGRQPRRWMFTFAIGVVAIAALVLAKPWGDRPAITENVPSGSAAMAVATTPVTELPVGQSVWLLDFDRSGLSPLVCLSGERVGCRSEAQLGSAIRFDNDQIVGDTGVAGGCDHFSGSLEFQEVDSISITIPVYESRCYETGADREIRDRLNGASRWHLEDQVLTLWDSNGTELLVYSSAN